MAALWKESVARYVMRQCAGHVATEKSAWDVGRFLRRRPTVVGATSAASGKVEELAHCKKPSLVLFEGCPSVEVRQQAAKWPTLTVKQTGWTNYVFGQTFLFPKDRNVLLVGCGGDCGTTSAYLHHAKVLAPTTPLVLVSRSDVAALAKLVGGSVLEEIEDVAPEKAAASAGNLAESLHVGDGMVAVTLTKTEATPIVAIIGPDHDRAVQFYEKALDRLDDLMAQHDAEDANEEKPPLLTENDDDKAAAFIHDEVLLPLCQEDDSFRFVLDHHTVFVAPHPPTALFPLYEVPAASP